MPLIAPPFHFLKKSENYPISYIAEPICNGLEMSLLVELSKNSKERLAVIF
jgi:hypothetical protein